MRISVIVPSYNRRHTLERALNSVAGQTSPVDELILVDDGSTDDSYRLVEEKFPGVSVIRQPNRGVSAARNRGIEAAGGDWIALLDSDDSWLPQKIERIRDAGRRHPDEVLFHSDEIWMRNGRRVNPMHKHRKSGGWIFTRCLPLCAISPSASVIRKSTLLELGMFDESLPACEDYDLWLRLCHRYPVHYVDEPLIVKYGGHEDQLSRRYPAMDRFRVRALIGLLQSAKLSAGDRRAAIAELLTRLDILVTGARKHRNQALLDEFAPLREAWGETGGAASC
ncbi:MAG: glycosyltransferase [Gammaproteobacteria bacterium]|jgi:glycosyltransferase involved in cell wall biosynthesis